MKNTVAFGLICLLFCTLLSCSSKNKETDDGITREYWPNGNLHKEMKLVDGKMTGYYKSYYKEGGLFEEMNFVKGKREGIAKKYYESGILCEATSYKKGMRHGIMKRFRRTGELMSEIPYYQSNLCTGMKEYSTDGTVKKRYPTIQFKPNRDRLKDGAFIVDVSLSDGSLGVEYFEGVLTEQGYIPWNAKKLKNVEGGIGKLVLTVPKNSYLAKDLHIIAKVKTVQSNYYITTATYEVFVEN